MSVTVLNICHICHQSCEVKRFSYKKIFTSQLNIRPTSKIDFYSFLKYISDIYCRFRCLSFRQEKSFENFHFPTHLILNGWSQELLNFTGDHLQNKL